MLNTKDFKKTQFEEIEYFENDNYFNRGKVLSFRMIDDSLKDAGINAGDVLQCREDFEPLKDEGCLFIVSLSGGDMVARFVEIADSGNLLLQAANEQIPDMIAFAETTDVVGIVVPKITNPSCEFVDYGFFTWSY